MAYQSKKTRLEAGLRPVRQYRPRKGAEGGPTVEEVLAPTAR